MFHQFQILLEEEKLYSIVTGVNRIEAQHIQIETCLLLVWVVSTKRGVRQKVTPTNTQEWEEQC